MSDQVQYIRPVMQEGLRGSCWIRKMMKWSALINPVMWDAQLIRLHLSIVEALNAYVPYTVTCGLINTDLVSALFQIKDAAS
ncbi:hypothetical protein Y032_0006g2777 [Ancylostoma ceylanicum]|uniref:Uncharacterized protein n=1 Tax=Ancylostoma ceylanicum TaxID=53326 RepID=A0A016VPZ0_9BILA|nr:hypothetical protein Y032_0006g2777 [Ancylostoma ceylanicum]